LVSEPGEDFLLVFERGVFPSGLDALEGAEIVHDAGSLRGRMNLQMSLLDLLKEIWPITGKAVESYLSNTTYPVG